jgi:DNA processing protein
MNNPAVKQAAVKDSELMDWLRLARTESVGPITFRQLLRRFGSAKAALAAIPELAARGGKRNFVPAPLAAIEREIAAHEKLGAKLVTWDDSDYPPLLAAIEDAPPVISLRGQISLLHRRHSVAIVGARNASLNGRRLAEILARDLGAAGVAVISGLARGIDTAAHQGSLASGTVAVLAGGIDTIYPPENAGLYENLATHGAIVAEMPFGSEPRAQHFPRRNRIISGLSQAVVVVEAALQSGSLITARMALEQGRDVFAVPGSPLDPRAGGVNALLKQGAILAQNAADILDHLPRPDRFEQNRAEAPVPLMSSPDVGTLAAARAHILQALGPAPVEVDQLIRDCDAGAAAVLTALLELELAGRIERHAGHRVSLLFEV